jgi:hypothetical protein
MAAIAPRIAFLALAVISGNPKYGSPPAATGLPNIATVKICALARSRARSAGRGAERSATNEELAIARDRVAVIS